MSKQYGLRYENKPENCVEQSKTHHIFLTETDQGFQRVVGRHSNILIEGENYHALKVLQHTHAGKIDVIGEDRPYNTGNDDFVYNDRFVSREDTYRHSVFLSCNERRLKLAYTLLTEQGIYFTHIDDNECDNTKLLLDSIFGEENFLARIVWDKRNSKGNVNHFACTTEYVLIYAKDKSKLRKLWSKKPNAQTIINHAIELCRNGTKDLVRINKDFRAWMKLTDFSGGEKAYNKIDSTGRVYRLVTLSAPNSKSFYDILHPITRKPCKTESRGWGSKPETMAELITNGQIEFGADHNTVPNRKYFLDENMDEAPTTMYSSAANGVDDLPEGIDFDYPKPVAFIKYLHSVVSQKDSIILDSYAGSGTTGQAIAELNAEDGGTRQFILITNNEKSEKLPLGICTQVCYPRLAKTIGNENLKYFRVQSLPKEGKFASDHIKQLIDGNKLIDLLKIEHNTFNEIEKTDQYSIFSNHDKSFFLAIWNDDIAPHGKTFQIKMDALCKNNKTLICRYDSYPKDYYSIINRK